MTVATSSLPLGYGFGHESLKIHADSLPAFFNSTFAGVSCFIILSVIPVPYRIFNTTVGDRCNIADG